MTNQKPTCPTCKTPVEADNRHRPFCSTRCANADLGRWLSGQYAVPSHEPPDSADMDALEKEITDAVAEGRIVPGDFGKK